MNRAEKARISNMSLDDFNRYQMGVKVSSSVLCETIIIASDNWKPRKAAGDIVVYTVSEIKLLLSRNNLTEDELELVHAAKKAWGGKIENILGETKELPQPDKMKGG